MITKTLFTNIFGVTPKMKVIDFLLENRELDFGVGDIAEEVKLSRQTVYTIIDDLINKKIVLVTRRLQNKTMYGLTNLVIVQRLKELFDEILRRN